MDNIIRYISIYSWLSILTVEFIVIGLRILRRNDATLNRYLAPFFFSQSVPWLLNLVYAPLKIDPLVTILHVMTACVASVGLTFLVIFLLILWKSKQKITKKVQLILLLSYAATFIIVIASISNGVIINESTGWKPYYKPHFSMITL